jgi:hypothetical protein
VTKMPSLQERFSNRDRFARRGALLRADRSIRRDGSRPGRGPRPAPTAYQSAGTDLYERFTNRDRFARRGALLQGDSSTVSRRSGRRDEGAEPAGAVPEPRLIRAPRRAPAGRPIDPQGRFAPGSRAEARSYSLSIGSDTPVGAVLEPRPIRAPGRAATACLSGSRATPARRRPVPPSRGSIPRSRRREGPR